MNALVGQLAGASGERKWGTQGAPNQSRRPKRRGGALARPTRLVAAVSALLLPVVLGLPVVAASAAVAPVGQGFTVTPSDLSFILKQIKIAEAHVANTTSLTGPCGALVGTGPNQLASPLLSFGLRTVDGSCNNLQPGQENFGAADQLFPRLGSKSFRPAEPITAALPVGPPGPTSYAQKSGSVIDSQPRVISNLVVDQTSTNPAAIAAAGFPVRTQGNEGVVPCTDPLTIDPVTGLPVACVPAHETLFIPNVTTDVGLSPPYNSLFTIFGQFFDHGVDQTVKGGGTVFVPLKADDPLIAGPDHIFGNADDLNVNLRFMVLTRGQNQPGADGILGNDDDVQDAENTDSPWVDQSQTYTSHPAHQVFLREYVNNTAGRPVSTGKLLGGPAGPTAGGIGTWATTKAQAAALLGLRLVDADATNIPMIAADPYGNFLPGAAGLPQYVTTTGLVEGNIGAPVPVPTNVLHFDTPFLTDIAHSAAPTAGGPDADLVAGTSLATPVPAGTYDNELLDTHFVCGDGRCNENIALSAIHQIFHSEHDRLIDVIKNVLTTDTSASGLAALPEWQSASGAAGWNGERLFQAARFVTEMEYQHLVFEEFARKVQPAINPFEPFAFTQTEINPAIKAEFAHAVYRFGHSMLTETISRTNEGGAGADLVFGTADDTPGTTNDISLLDGFLNPPTYTNGGPAGPLTSEDAAGSIIMGMSDQVGNELDEFVTETLRNNLLGLPLDLPTINMTRARSEGIPSLNVLRRELFASTNDGQLRPYISWVDFGENLKHPESLVNFVAAYGTHPSITGATTLVAKRTAARLIVSPDTLAGDVPPVDAAAFMNSAAATSGLDNVDLWVGGLAEVTTPFGGLLGTTFNYVFEQQLTDLQNGDRFYYLARTPGMNLRTQLEGNSFAELMMRNTNAHSLKADAFATADCKFELKNLAGTVAGFAASGNTVADDPASECNESAVLLRMPDGTIQYRARNTVDPAGINGQSVYNGTAQVDRVYGGNDNDTFWGGLGNDVIEGGGGADVALGGEGNDIITDLAGDDVPKGGPGNDAIDAGPGLDIVMGGEGKDFTNGGANANETFGGDGDDFIILGESLDAAFGDSGDDWQEGGNQPDLMQGDSGNLFFLDDSQKPGSDILIGQGGDDDYDMEGGDDIGVAGPGIEKNAGASGYDWSIGLGDPQPQDADLALPIAPLEILQAGVRDKFNEVEALSGGNLDDKLRGDDVIPAAVGGGGFIGNDFLTQASTDLISGLADLLPPDATLGASTWGEGNILLGGSGSDLIEGRGADDIIDGDKYLSVRLSVRDAAGAEIGSASIENAKQSAMTSQYLRVGGVLTGPTLQEAVFAGTVDPGNIVAVREILTGSGGTDQAVFSDIQENYTCTVEGQPAGPCDLTSTGATTLVAHVGGTAVDGIDTIRNIEQLVFSDTVVPAAPIIGVATAGNGSATVNFTPPVSTVTGFSVRVANAATNAQIGALLPVDAAATSLTVTGLTNGIAVRFQVSATNAVGTGPFSALSNAVTPAAPVITAPATPGTPTATAGNASALVSFSAPPNGGSAITGFSVRVVDAANVQVGALRPAAAGATNLTVTGLVNGTAVRFQVQATNAVGSSAFSPASAAVTPVGAPSAPAIGTATPGNASALVRWTAPANNGSAITGFSVRVVTAAAPTVQVGALRPAAAGATQLNVTGLVNGTAYRFQVRATNAVGTSPFSALSVAVTPATPPGAPVIGTATPGNLSALVRWTPPASNGGSAITGYQVRVFNSSNLQVGALRPAAAGATGLTVTGLVNGTAYRFQVRASNAAATGAFSALSNFVTPVTLPGAPVIGTATSGAAGGVINALARWTPPASNGGAAINAYVVIALRINAAGTVLSQTTSAFQPATARSLTMTLVAGNYRFTVRARNAVGLSALSARSNLVTAR